jgi:CBS domain-containing protein
MSARKMHVRDIMTPDVITVPLDCPVTKAAHILRENRVSSAAIIGGAGELAGMVTASDIVSLGAATASEDCRHSYYRFPENTMDARSVDGTVASLCNGRVITVDAEATISRAGKLMLKHNVHHLLVISDGRLAGIVSSLDLVRAATSKEHTS